MNIIYWLLVIVYCSVKIFQSLVPSVLSTNDVNQLLQVCLKTKTGAQILCDTIVISEKMIQDVVRSFDTDILVKAERVILEIPCLVYQYVIIFS